ncbi:MAG: hypothetical protein A3B96_04260 [Candidatus Spechtbacteria bacterium RIFCSPHIGHO2_02_FULL_43_15b]|uniref:Uncharacterized protein n=1 Tax=Candidatus Spechtbacteria bacterium RIFCSPHIGHO2_01_FULL_43_30 TaxID=1802158 RepID=A0A1G2H906_9BACT|nr:MAG: hypothetical protein A2827_01825 [Candidatus Spechtbacteria bacterium RIFCSPHIGHO2_01_FULL_43_30]OGZ58548.1 MAG: hypothetical protein A3B96_04260 [Candidatus Spechtbacteria bacterium RIFCSPHIGHO2_02_FULL_43_15b]
MYNIKNILVIIKKELRGYFDGPTAYVVIIAFLLLWEFLFFQSAFVIGEASLRPFFSFLPWIYLFLIPAITMGSISQEKSEGTIELLLTHPIRENELLIGKYKGILIFLVICLLITLPLPFSLDIFGDLDWGVVFGQYLASFLLGAAFISLGLFISGIFLSQISAFLVTAFAGFLFIIIGSPIVTASLPSFVGQILEQVSFLPHYESMARGVIDIRDLLYFVSAAFIFMGLGHLQFLKRKFGNRKARFAAYQLWLSVFIGIVVAINIFGSRVPGRVDLTENSIYTLSNATKDILADLDDKVEIRVYSSNDLPPQFQPISREVNDTLRDYKIYGQGNINVTEKNPSESLEISEEAMSYGIQEVQFNVVGNEELRVKRGYLGIAVVYGDNHESVPFVNSTADLEYQLTSFIKKLTTEDKGIVGFLSGHGEKSIFSDYSVFNEELEKQFVTRDITINEENPEIPEDLSALVVAGPTQGIDKDTRGAIKNYLNKGGSVMFLLDGVIVSPQTLIAEENENSFSDFVEEYGVKVASDLVYDVRSNETVTLGSGFFSYLLPYPFWPKVVPIAGDSQITSRIGNVTLLWPSSIEFDKEKMAQLGISDTMLFSTTKFGGSQKGAFDVNPEVRLSEENLSEKLVAVTLTREGIENETKPWRIIVVSDSDFLVDQFASASKANVAFGMEALSWLSQEQSLGSIRVKQLAERKLLFEDNTQKFLLKYGNLAFVVLLPIGFSAWRMMRRRGLRKLTYKTK